MMYAVLQQYLELHRQLIIPGIGTFSVHRNPAEFDHATRMILPASYSILLHHDNSSPSNTFYQWLATRLQLSNAESESRFVDFARDLRKRILSGDKVTWDNIGSLTKGLAGEIRFESSLRSYAGSKPIAARKVIRENVDHVVRVGEEQKTSSEMKEILQPAPSKRNVRWLAASLLAILAIILLAIYVSRNGWSFGNQHAVEPAVSPSTYQVVQ